ncbi:MAG: 5'-nucleotidase C-terminal domain-containing protein, partial [Mangrovicoccus sp.]
ATNDDPFDVDDRSDNKGGEPEALAITEIDGMQVAIVGLERGNHLIGFDISDPTNPTIIGNIPLVDPADEGSDDYPNSDLGPEGLIVIAADESISGNQEIVVASEVSGTLSVFELGDDEEDDTFTLQLFHVADQEAGGAAISDAPNFSAVLNALRGQDVGADSTLTLSSGDAFIPGLFYDASAAVFGSAGIADIQIQNELGIQAIALGNHEFDFDTAELAALIDGSAVGDFSALTGSTLEGLDFTGTDMPYLSTNLDFSTDSNLAGLEVAGGQAPVGNVVTSSTVIEQDGEVFGIVGATTPTLASISSPGTVGISPAWAGTIPTEAELDALAAEIQAEVDALLAANPSMNKVILLAHMQQISIEQALAARLVDVDIIVAGGSNTRLLDEDDRLRDGDTVQGEYPIVIGNAGGTDTLVVNTDGSYKYVGRLVIEFDADGNILADSYDSAVSGAYATDDQGVADLSAEALVDPEIQAIADAIEAQILATEGNVFGVSDVFLNGNRSGDFSDDDPDGVRTQETNLGNLTADANLAFAQSLDSEVVISLKNGGGIRASIGQTIVPAGGSEAVRIANEEVVDSQGNVVKPEGGISQNDIQTTLAFNNGLVLMTLTVEEIVAILEHGVGSLPNVAGGFPQLSGVKFSFDPDLPSGARILNAVITDEDGNAIATLVQEGVVQNPTDTYRIVTLDFLSSPRFDDDGNFTGAGDGYPFPNTNTDPAVGEVGDADVIARVNKVFTEQEDVQTGDATFADDGTEQDALAEYLLDNFADLATAFSAEDTDPSGDERIQNLDYRADTVLDGPVYDEIDLPDQGGDLDRSGREENLIIRGSDGDDTITLGRGDNLVRTGLGQDRVKFGEGQNKVKGKLEELDGDTIENFDDGDELVLENTLVGRGNMSIRQGSAIIDIDQDGDGAIDATVTIEGDFHDANGNLKDGDFMAVKNGTDTDVSFEKFLPMLQDRAQLSDDMVNGINNQDFLNGDGSTDFRLTMVDLGYARFDSAVGSYAIDIATGEISDVQIHFSNQNTDAGLTSNIIDLGAGQ